MIFDLTLLRDFVGNLWLISSLGIFAFLLQYVLKVRFREGIKDTNSDLAFGLTAYFFGDCLMRGAFIVMRLIPAYVTELRAAMLAGLMIATIGAICIVRVFSSAYLTPWAFIYFGLGAIAIAGILAAL